MKHKRLWLLVTTLVAFLFLNQPVTGETQPAVIQIAFDPPVGTPDTSFTATVKNFSWSDMANLDLVAYNQFTDERIEIASPDNIIVGPRRRATVTLPSFEPGIWSVVAEGSWVNGGDIVVEGAVAVGTPGVTTGELDQDQVVQGTIMPFTNDDYEDVGFGIWSIAGKGESPVISLNWQANETNTRPSPVTMLLFDSTGDVIVDPDESTLIADFMLAEETYYLFIIAYEVGITYDLTLSEPPQGDSEGGTITLGSSLVGQIGSDTDKDSWSFMATVGQVIEIRLDGSTITRLDGELLLTDANGNLLVSNDDCQGNNPCLLYTIPSTGQYQVTAQSYNHDSSGTYQLTLKDYPDLNGSTHLIYDDSQQGFTPPGNGEAWQFEGQSGDAVTILVMAIDDGFDPSVTLYGPDGTELGHDDDGGGDLDSRLIMTIPQTGVYTITVTGYGGDSGRYRIFLDNE